MVLSAASNDAAIKIAVRRIGPALVFERLWEETGCLAVIEELAATRKHGFALERAVFLTVLHRLFVSGSDRAADRWREDYRIAGIDGLDLHHLYRAMILASPAPRFGILPLTDGEKQAARELMGLGPFWTTAIHPSFEIAAANSLNCIPPSMRQSIFDRFGSESGRALFELFFWMFDSGAATALDVDQIRCPVMCFSGTEDRLISLATARATANGLQQAYFWEATGHGHMLLLEPQAERLAERIVDWIPT